MRKLANKVISCLIAVVMTVTAFSVIPVMAQTGITVFNYDGYMVEYNVLNEWDGHQSIDVKITNTGTEPILNWAFKYDAGGEVTGLWNGVIYENGGTEYIIKNAGYNYEIAPNSSVNFGYTLAGNNLKAPDNFEIYSNRIDLTEGFDVQLRVDNSWNTGFNGFIIITNTMDVPLEAWTLDFDANFTINDLWNGRIIESLNGHYKVTSQQWSNPILPGASIEIGITGSMAEGVTPAIENCVLSVVQIGAGNDIPIDPDPEITITANADYDRETGLITVNWETNEPEGIFEILVSYDEENFNVAGTVTNDVTYSFEPEEFELLYVKVRQTDGERTAESEVCPVVNTTEEIDMNDPTDTDGDDITDVYEIYIYKTDPNNSDTDGDMLPDRYELFMLGTDPIMPDTDENGINDSEEDFDNDGLTNLDEFTRETNPSDPDTDGDTLNDYDEIYTYNTDPLKWDTDDDKVSDGDEIALGLDPNNPETYGYPDSEYTTEQTLSEDSDGLNYINDNPDNPFTVSVDIIAAGVADNNLYAQESGYSNAVDNPAIIGVVPELVYSDGLEIEEVEISFNVDNSAVNNTLGTYVSTSSAFEGIGRLTIFKFFEGYNALLPIETFYDEENNRVYANVDELGTYCLIDMEIWLNELNIAPQQSSKSMRFSSLAPDTATQSVPNDNTITAYGAAVDGEDKILSFDIFVKEGVNQEETQNENQDKVSAFASPIQPLAATPEDPRTSGCDIIVFPTPRDTGNNYPAFVKRSSRENFKLYDNARIYILDYDGSLIINDNGKNYAESYIDVLKMADKISADLSTFNLNKIAETYTNTISGFRTNMKNEIPSINQYDIYNYYAWSMPIPFGYVDLCLIVNMLTSTTEINFAKESSRKYANMFLNDVEKVNIYMIDSVGNMLTTSEGKIYATNITELEQMLTQVDMNGILAIGNVDRAFRDLCDNTTLIYSPGYVNYALGYTLSAGYNEYGPVNEYKTGEIISSANLKPVNLENEVTSDFPQLSQLAKSARMANDYELFYSQVSGSFSDSDQDNLFDFEEILYEYNGIDLADFNSKGNVILPTLEELKYLIARNENITYLDGALERYWAGGAGTDSLKSKVYEKAILSVDYDPNSTDGDGDGIIDYDEYKVLNKIDTPKSRSQMLRSTTDDAGGEYTLKPLAKDTVEKIMREKSDEFKPYSIATTVVYGNTFSGYMQAQGDQFMRTPTYIWVNGNDINIYANIHYNNNSIKAHNITAKTVEEIIEETWRGSYEGSSLDFYHGMKINLKTNVFVSSDTITTNPDGTETIINPIEEYNYIEFNLNDPYEGSRSSGTLQFGIGKFDNLPKINFFTDENETAIAHEFGHILGIGDAYGSRSVLKSKIDNSAYIYHLELFEDMKEVPKNDIMRTTVRGSITSLNDIEMLLTSFATGKSQVFADANYEDKYDVFLSSAIKTPYLIYGVYENNEEEIKAFYLMDVLSKTDLTELVSIVNSNGTIKEKEEFLIEIKKIIFSDVEYSKYYN